MARSAITQTHGEARSTVVTDESHVKDIGATILRKAFVPLSYLYTRVNNCLVSLVL